MTSAHPVIAARRQLSPETLARLRANARKAGLARAKQFEERRNNRLFCGCGKSIPRPEGASKATHYTCPACCQAQLANRPQSIRERIAEVSAQVDAALFPELESLPAY